VILVFTAPQLPYPSAIVVVTEGDDDMVNGWIDGKRRIDRWWCYS
jgi:hypothetical protein